MRSPIRCGKPALGMAESGTRRIRENSRSDRNQELRPDGAIGADGLNIFPSISPTRRGRPPPKVVPSCEKVICATMGSREKERMASMAARSS